VAIVRVVASDELVEVAASQRVRLEREVFVRSMVVGPRLLRPRLLARDSSVEKEDVCLHALRAEDAGGQSQERADIVIVEQFATHFLAGATLEEDVIRYDDGGASGRREGRLYMLEEVANSMNTNTAENDVGSTTTT
jgi:hypothetical protein